MSATGAVVWSRFLGGSGAESSNGIVVSNGSVFILGGTQSTNYPVTNGTAYSSSNSGFYTKLDAVTGAIQFSTYMPGGEFIKVDNGSAYIFRSDGFNGTTFRIYKYDVTTNALLLQKTFNSGSNGNFIRQAEVVDGIIYMAGETYYNNYYPTTDGTTSGGAYEAFYTKFDGRTGEVLFSTMLNNQCRGPFATSNSIISNASEYFDIKDGGVYFYGYITGCASKFVTTDGSAIPANPWTGFFLRKYDAISNKILYSKIFNLYFGSVRVENGIVYMGNNTDYNGHLAFTKLNAATGAIISSGSLNSNSSEKLLDMQVKNGDLYLLGTTKGDATNTYPVTNGSTKKGAVDSTDYVLTKINAQNQICYSTFLGGNNSEYGYATSLLVDNDFAYVTSISRLTDYPVTNSSSNKGAYDFVWTKFNINPASNFSGDNLTPASQTVCKNNSSVATLSGPAFSISGNSLPNLYRQGVAESQTTIAMMYQWQQASSASGPWSDIPGAIKVNYTPQAGEVTTYYRRLTSTCDSLLSTSSVATVAVNSNTAPTINVGSVVNTCLGSTTRLGGSPTATGNGGATIASYQWTPAGVYMPNNASANPTVSPTTTTIYTVLVTDNNGCQSLGQQLVNVYKADAGPDASTCVGKIVRIGGAPIQGLSGLTYSWSASPADPSMSCTNCAQPDVHPTAATTYTLTMTIPVTGGGTCSTTDVVTVTPVAAPVTPNFAGPDKTFCISDLDAFLGTPKESGFTYVWAPGNYLQWNNVSSTRFQPGNLAMPNPNPIKYYLTAIKQGCSFVDSTYASVIEARAGVDGCGPRYVGMPDRTPNINETYSWTKVSGPGNFTGATNLPMVPVSSSGSGSTTYRLTVSYNGTTCTDDVVVPPCGCVVDIAVEAPFVCPSFGLNGGANSVKLTATAGDIFSSDPSVFTYTWSPNVGLSAYSGREVYLTDNVERTYTVTMGSPFDPSFNCTRTIHVNNPAWSLPVFQAKDVTTCPGISVSIGQPTVAGYSYAWTDPQKYLNDTTLSNPTAIVRGSQYFPVLVVDVGSGCVARDTAHVIITGMPAGIAGSDIQMCGSGTVQLGQSPLPNVTYLWTPAASYQPNNTAANPTIPVAATTSFYLQATNSVTGCVVNDTVKVTVKSPVAPFSFTNQTYCPSTSRAMPLPAGPSGMASYSWSPASLVVNPKSNGPTATTQSTRPASATTFTLTVTNAAGCTGSANVTFTPSVIVPTAGDNKSICLGSTVQLGGPSAGGTYAWTSSPASGVTGLSSAVVSNPVFNPTAAGTYVFTVTRTDPGGCRTTANVTITVNTFTLTNVMPSPTVCQNSCVQIGTNDVVSGTQYYWNPSTGLSDPAIPNPYACVGNTSQTYTLTGIGANGCQASQTIVVGVNPTPAPSVTIPDVTACLADSKAMFSPSVSPSGTYNYQWSPNDGTLNNIYAATPTVILTGTGTKTYNLIVTNTSTGCATTATGRLNVNICNTPSCVPPSGVSALPKLQTICEGGPAGAYTASPATGVEYQWYGPLTDTTSSLGTGIGGATSASYTPSGTALTTAGTKYYAVRVSNAGDATCSDTAYVRLVVNAKPAIANGTAAICSGESVDLTSKIASYATYQSPVWSIGTAGGTAVTNPTVVKPTATTTYILVAQNATGCKDTAQVVVTVNAKPVAGTDQSLCSPVTTTSLTGFSPAGGTWSAQTGNPAAATVTNAGAVSGMSAVGTYKFIYSLNGCSDTVSVIIKPKPVAGTDQSLCSPATTASLTGFSPAGGTWSAQTGNPAAAIVTNAGAVSGMSAAGTYKFIYSLNGCADTVSVIINAKPAAGADQSLACANASTNTLQTTTTLTGFSPAGGSWTAMAGNPATATVTNAGAVSGMNVAGVYQFIYTVNGCSDTVRVTVQACAGCTKPSAGTDQSLCSPMSTTNLTGFSPAGGTWTAQTGNPASATVTNAGAVSGMSAVGTYRFIYSVTSGGQTCSDTVSVIIRPKPVAGADQSICSPATTTSLTGFSPAGGTWSAQTGNPAVATVTNAGAVSGMSAAGTYKFIYSLNGCSDTVSVVINAKPVAGTDQTLTSPTSTTSLTGFSPAGGTWTAMAGNPATATVTNAGTVTGMSAVGTYRFIYSITANGVGCSDTIAVTINVKPSAGLDQSLCSPMSTTNLTGFSPAGGTWTAQTGNPAAATVTNAGAVSGMSVVGTYRFIYSVPNNGSDTVSVIINAKPVAGADQSICAPATTTSLTGFSPAGGTWSAQTGNPAGATVTNAGLVSGMSAVGTYRFIYSVTSGGQTCSDTVSVIIKPKPVAGADQSICAPATTTSLTSFSPAGGTWSAQTGNPAAAIVTNAGAVSGMSAVGTYKFIYSLNGCSDTVSVIINAKPVAGADQSLACANASTNTLQTTTSLTGFSPAGGAWSAMGGNPATAAVTNAGAVSGMSAAGTYKFIYTLNGCSDTVRVTVQACVGCTKPSAGADQSLCSPMSTTNLTGFSPAGGTWSAQMGNPAGATVTNAGAVTGMSVVGTYRFIYSVTSGGQTCSDTVSVIIKPKPVAGTDQSLCSPATTASLTGFSPAGGTWSAQTGNPASAIVTNAGAVSGMSAAGTYKFIYTLNGCSDTVSVIIKPKPVAGTDQTLTCTSGSITSTSLTGFSPAGGTWSAMAGNPATAAVTNAGAVSGMSVAGTYKFIYSLNGCADTVSVQVPSCSFDLALRKVLPSGAKNPTVAPGDTVTFNVVVYNQGNVDATNVRLVDYIPAGLTLADANWTASGSNATLNTPIASLAAGSSVTRPIRFVVNAGFTGSIRNFAEISGAQNANNLDDIDSTPDSNPNNDGTPKDDVINEDHKNNPGQDEDDSDYEDITVSPKPVFDLGLRKVLPSGSKNPTVAPGDTVTFNVVVYNQGNVDATNVRLVDYIPAGLTLADANWTASGSNATLNTPIASLAAGTSTTRDISFIVNLDFSGSITNNTGSITNTAEISAATGGTDVDSNPDNDPTNDGTPKNDVISEDHKKNPTDDEDDSDIETITVTPAPVFDLALRKVLPGGIKNPTVVPGDTVTFNIEVYNQGNVDATNVSLVDYIPAGLTLADGNWTASGSNATLNTPIASLTAGSSVTRSIRFVVNAGFTGSIRNFAEISSANNLDDIDSTPDSNPSNDGTPKDDVINEDHKNNPGQDEDDADYEDITVSPKPVFDLGLRKVLPSGSKNPTVVPGDTVTFNIEVYNQGNVAATNISLVDYIPAGLTLADANWTASGSNATLNTPIASLAAGSSVTRPIRFVVNAGFTGSIRNFAEISGAQNANNLDDIDSTPDSNPNNDGTPKDDVINEDHKNNPGQDEDDSDIEVINVGSNTVDLALKKEINKKIARLGETVTYTLKVWNESAVSATGVVARDSLPAGVEYLNSSASRGSYDPSSGLWTIGNVGANGDTVTVTIQVKVVAEGIWFNTAEIFKSDQTDKDSTPGNGVEGEDDMGRQCFTVPIKLCPQGNVQIIVPAENNVQWFKDGGSTPVASGNTVRLNEPGIYTFRSSAGNCPAEGCCPVIIEADNNCCKDEICVPFTIQKRKKN